MVAAWSLRSASRIIVGVRRATIWLIAFVASTLVVTACSGGGGGADDDDDDDGTTTTPTATPTPAAFAGAVGAASALAVLQGPLTTAAFGSGGEFAASELVAIDSAGNVTHVFNEVHPTWGFVLTSSHVVASGNFLGVHDTDGNSLDCYLVAIPRTASGGPAQCLSQEVVGTYAPGEAFSNGHYDEPGIASDGLSVYFTMFENTQGKSELRGWDGISDSTDLLVQLDATDGSRFYTPFAAQGVENVCALASAVNSAAGKLVCGDPSLANWSQAPMGASPVLAETMQLGNLVVSTDKKVDLADLTVADRVAGGSNGGLPKTRAKTVFTGDGGAVGIGYGNSYFRVDPNGDTSTLDGTAPWERLLGGAAYGWLYGGGELRRFDMFDGTLGATNYLSQTTMLQVTGMAYSTEDRLRLDGTGAAGGPVVVAIDTSSGAISVISEDIPRLGPIVPLE